MRTREYRGRRNNEGSCRESIMDESHDGEEPLDRIARVEKVSVHAQVWPSSDVHVQISSQMYAKST
eukprot:scaffold3051_cov92-Cylindrotheca_fusiformis.AAC.1